MNKITFIVFITLVAAENLEKHVSSPTIPQKEDNLFYRVNENLENMTDKLFEILKVNKTFIENRKIQLLLRMHDNLRNIAENNFLYFEDIKNASKAGFDTGNKTGTALFNLTDVVENIFKEKPSTNTSAVKELARYVPNSTFDLEPSRRSFRSSSYNLKVWHSPNSSELFRNRRIFKSTRAKTEKYAFVASIIMANIFMCAGSIISKGYVLTAASCLQIAYKDKKYDNKLDVNIRAGSDYTTQSGEIVPVVDVAFHPSYDVVYLQHNLAIAKLKTRLQFRSKNTKVRRIEYDRVPEKLPESGGIVMLGWGDQDPFSRYNGPLTMARLEVYGLESCKEIYSEHYVNEENFCAGSVTAGSGACYRDVGGPGIIGSKLVGLVSFGPPVCGTPDAPTVFTKIGYYAEWIDSVIKEKSTAKTTKHTLDPVTSTKSQNARIRKKPDRHRLTDYTKKKNKLKKRRPRKDNKNPKFIYSQKVFMLRKLFKELVLSGNIAIDDLFYLPEDPDDQEFWATTKISAGISHPLVNHSLYHITKPPMDSLEPTTTTPSSLDGIAIPILPPQPSDQHIIEEIEKWKKIIGPILEVTRTAKEQSFIDVVEQIDGEIKSNSLSSENYEENFNDKSEEKGMSIEIPQSMKKPSNVVRAVQRNPSIRESDTDSDSTDESDEENQSSPSHRPVKKSNEMKSNKFHSPKLQAHTLNTVEPFIVKRESDGTIAYYTVNPFHFKARTK